MGGEAAEIPLLKPHQRQISFSDNHRRGGGIRIHFPVGSSVEVRTDEEDFKGVYFSATVVLPLTGSPRKSGRKKSRKLFVEYHNLLAHEDGSDRLREFVDVSFVRPAPPLQEILKGFEPDDVVDAFYKDGWWTGVVSRVVEGGERFVVTFQNPPDELEFGLAELRAHWDWVNGSWVRPQKQNIAGLMFDVGRKVEVSFDREDFQDAWFPATIHQDLGNGVFLVEYNSANMDNKGQPTKITVDSLHVRPCPPLLKDKNFVLLEKVDAYYDSGWWSGVITKELENSRYNVFFKQMKQDKEFNQSELRPHMEWKDGKWFTSSQRQKLLQEEGGRRTLTFLSLLCMWHKLSQEVSIPSSDDGVHEHNTPENSSASAATAPVKNSLDGKDASDGKTPSSLTSEGHFAQFTPDNQKMPHVTTSLTKRKQYLCDSGTALSQPPKKLKEGNVVEEDQQDRHDKPIKELLLEFICPDSLNNVEISETQTTVDQSSSNPSWENEIRKQRNIRAKQNVGGKTKSLSSSVTKSSTEMLPPESLELDVGGRVPDAAGITEEDAQNEHAKEGTELPIIIGLPCVETGSSEFGISGGKRSRHSNSKEMVNIVNDQVQLLNSSTIQQIKDSAQSQIGVLTEKRKRGRPRKILVESTQTSVSGDLNEKGDGLQRNPEVVLRGTEASMPDQEKMEFNKELELVNGLSDPKHRKVRMTKRTLAWVHQDKGVKESVGLGESRSKRGRIRISSVKIADQVQDSRTVEVEKVGDEIPSNAFDDKPLSKWIEEMHSPSVVDGLRLEGVMEQCMANAKKQRDGVVLNEASEKQPESGRQVSAFVDRGSIVPSEPQSLPSVANTVGFVLDKDSEKQPESGTEASALVDLVCIVPYEPQSLPSLENTVGIVLDKDTEQQPESGTQASALVDNSSIVPSELQSLPSVENTVVVVLDKDSEKQPESGMQPCALVYKGSILPSEPQSLPFEKNTSLWKTIESMEVFQRIPQKPHFQPLVHFKESSREGLAIGYMVTFASLVEKAFRLQLNDPRSVIDDIIETLADLERHGFDVKVVEDRVTKLLAVKDKEEKLVDEVNNLNNQILEHNHKRTRIGEEIQEINDQIRKLQEKLSLAESAKEKEDDEIASLQARLKETEESIKNARCDLEGMASIL